MAVHETADAAAKRIFNTQHVTEKTIGGKKNRN